MMGPGSVRPATGEQFVLRRGSQTARVGQVAAVLREFSVDGVHYTETWPDEQTTPMGCGMVLMPWPNRVAGGRWRYDGAPQQLDITEPARGHAIHGLLRNTPYQPRQVAEDTVILAATVYPQHGWPFTLDTTVAYALTDAGLRVTHQVTNVGGQAAVFGCGAHPYLRVGEIPSADLTLAVRASTHILADDAMIPIGTEPLAGVLTALPDGVRVGELDIDTGFTDLELTDGCVRHTLRATDGRGVALWADPVFAYAQVFTPRNFPAVDGPRQAVAIEPMTCPPNALGSGTGLITLQPGEDWSASWGITPIG